jgi:hypothetical protein
MQLYPAKLQLELVEVCGALLTQGTTREPDHVVAQATGDRSPSLRARSAEELDLDGRGPRIGVVHRAEDTRGVTCRLEAPQGEHFAGDRAAARERR